MIRGYSSVYMIHLSAEKSAHRGGSDHGSPGLRGTPSCTNDLSLSIQCHGFLLTWTLCLDTFRLIVFWMPCSEHDVYLRSHA